MKDKKIIQKVWKNKYNNQKAVTIPKDSDIEEGDYVYIQKVIKEVLENDAATRRT